MQPLKPHWKVITRSEFPWEQEALDFIYDKFPDQANYRAWTNFEFLSGGPHPTRNEVDLLVACPQGVFLIEIKSHPGAVSGDNRDWTFSHEGRRKTIENPLFLTDKKCKRLKGLLERDPAFRSLKHRVPFIEPLVFLSDENLINKLSGNANFSVCLRDRKASDDFPARPGIMAAIKRRECPGLPERRLPVVNAPQLKALSKALANIGVRPSQNARKVNDFILGELIDEHPEGLYQDYEAKHSSIASTLRTARCYVINRKATEEERQIVEEAALREARIAGELEHQGILRADPLTRNEDGPVLFFKRPPNAQRLDHFLAEHKDSLSVDDRLSILRQLAETVQYVHRKQLVHRSLSPRSILIEPAKKEGENPRTLIFNWQTGSSLSDTSQSPLVTRFTGSIHADQLLEDSSHIYLAPEVLNTSAPPASEQDIFSLGAIAYLLFSGEPPADSAVQLQQKLNRNISGLNITESMDAAPNALVDLVRTTTHGSASDRGSVDDFLEMLNWLEEELTQPELDLVDNPLHAKKGDTLRHGLTVIRRLGSGSISIVFLVTETPTKDTPNPKPIVLKVARDPKHNERIRSEYQILHDITENVKSGNIVSAHQLFEFQDLAGFTMDLAGEYTVAQELKEKGPYDMQLLERYGEELISTIRDLDEAGGIAHRDIKPDNMGIRKFGSQHRLCLFDFSLAQASPDHTQVGTPPYLDPFIDEREIPRWDISSECFSAAVTLHQMATGFLPRWGDGKSSPAAVPGEVTLPPEIFDSNLREAYLTFFAKALRRNFRERFDNPSEMLRAWREIFADADKPRTETAHSQTEDAPDKEPIKKRGRPKGGKNAPKRNTTEFTFELPELLTSNSQLASLPISARLDTALHRLDLLTIADLLSFPQFQIYRLPGVGNKTRRELGALVNELRAHFPKLESDPRKPGKKKRAATADETHADLANIDLIAEQAATLGAAPGRKTELTLLQTYLGWLDPQQESPDTAPTWLSQADLASRQDVSRQRIGQALTTGRKKWAKLASITSLRETIHHLVQKSGGILTREELISAVLASRKSEHGNAQALIHASTATRAALETERLEKDSRFLEYRAGAHLFIATAASLKGYALELGKAADSLAASERLPGAPIVIARLREIAPPTELPQDYLPPSDQRLCELAVAVSEGAALSSRLEIYPVGLDPRRALMLSQAVLLSDRFTVEDLHERVRSRLPEAAPLPGNPELKDLITALGLPLEWKPDENDGEGTFVRPQAPDRTIYSQTGSQESAGSLATAVSTRPDYLSRRTRDVRPEHLDAFAKDKELTQATQEGRYLVLSVPPGTGADSSSRLVHHFGEDNFAPINLDELFLAELRYQADAQGVQWSNVLTADACPPDSQDQKYLRILIDRCLPSLREKLIHSDRTTLLYHPGLLARFDKIHFLDDLAHEVGRTNGPHGLWIVIPATGQSLPLLNKEAVPLPNPAAHHWLSRDYLEGHHRR